MYVTGTVEIIDDLGGGIAKNCINLYTRGKTLHQDQLPRSNDYLDQILEE